MNNKGFAVSTLIYGLSIMGIMLIAILMGTMSNSRNNARQLSDSVEKELISFSKTEAAFSPSGGEQSYAIGEGQGGWYRIELWGAQGGNGSLGAYTSGVIKLSEGDTLYISVGKHNASGYGEASDIKLVSGDINSRIMVAAGGGAANNAPGGTLVGYKEASITPGGLINEDGEFTGTSLIGVAAGYSIVDLSAQGPNVEGTGGRGYHSSNLAEVGGTSYIAGYGGSGEAYILIEDGYEGAGDSYYFVDGMMLPGVKEGDGKALITKVVSNQDNDPDKKLKIVNNKFTKVNKIKDCIDGTESTQWRVYAMVNGHNVATAPSGPTVSGNQTCMEYTVNSEYVDEIAIYHNTPGKDYKNHTVEVIKTDGTSAKVKAKSSKTELSLTETSTGIHISAYQYDSTGKIPSNGNYLILPVLYENKALTAAQTAMNDSNPIETKYINGEKTQMWSIEKLDNKLREKENEYKIIELSRYKALNITLNENKVRNSISASTSFNNYARNEPQIWEITAMSNGTYTIETVVDKLNNTINTGNIVPNRADGKLMIGIKDNNVQRYRLVSVEYQ